MDHLNSFADSRLVSGCLYCGSRTENREHIPSRVLLNTPYPENLPVLPCCKQCNSGFSLDEEYFACLVECARTGSIDSVVRPKIRRILQESPMLASRIMSARTAAGTGEIIFKPESERIISVVVKLARGHAVYELAEQRLDAPAHVMAVPLHTLTPEALGHFENPPQPAAWPEVGTRAMQRMVHVTPDGSFAANDWIEVQEGQYRYTAIAEGAVLVRMVISEYLACEVIWEDD